MSKSLAERVWWRLRPTRYRPRYTTPRHHGALSAVLAYNRYGGYCVPRSSIHRPAAQYVMSGNVYEPRTIEFIVENCREDRDIIHAGTYFGDFLPALSVACGGTVWAFEPNPENHRCATMTLAMNDLDNVELFGAALGPESRKSSMITRDDTGRSLGGASHIGQDGDALVDMVAIDDVVPGDRNVALIHLDVEFYEAQALAGALATIRRCRPLLILETVPEDWIAQHLPEYRLRERIHENSVLAPG